MKCRACGHAHDPMLTCGRAARLRATAVVVHAAIEAVVHSSVVVHADGPVVVHRSRHGKHIDCDARKAYRRDWMRAKRAGERAAK